MSLSIPIQLTIFLAASITAESPQIDLDARPVIVSIPSPAGEKESIAQFDQWCGWSVVPQLG